VKVLVSAREVSPVSVAAARADAGRNSRQSDPIVRRLERLARVVPDTIQRGVEGHATGIEEGAERGAGDSAFNRSEIEVLLRKAR
jgi:hypothetical protein